ncbi:MAG: transglycosylase domain-containing protein [Bacteroidales bacterium]|jgi:penicillin-binding protein 1A|nr:transglycosylase domain-containing protein [Bacteroidales bacterium]MDI9575118.1 transglycosylase domain-containing protein [Bacteroidota bacterium]MDD2593216.1 transglycosylase domain-containing protein [Bacteroidales bacterium]MDD3755201.1 transglycosylase domain-containing protein [Bacteroidales bacterium]MDY0400328.1 transglycosylase domain-containing protein [Bacteroidales bacterium]
MKDNFFSIFKTEDENFKKFLKNLWIIFFCILGFIFIFFIGVYYGLLGPIPSFEQLENPLDKFSSELISVDDNVIGKYYYEENRSWVSYNEISPYVIQALIATEDKRFYKHSGIDFKGLARVFFKTIIGQQKGSGGGSTITQQLAKNLFKRPDNINKIKLIGIKFREWMTAIKLERNYSKDEIIAMYLNTVPFGYQLYGVKSASLYYFGKNPNEIDIDEAAILIGMLKATTRFNPILNPENAKNRRNIVLKQMLKNQFINKEQYDSLKVKEITKPETSITTKTDDLAPYFREYLRLYMTAKEPDHKKYKNKADYKKAKELWDNDPLYGWCNKNTKPDGKPYNLYSDGLRIYTTIDSRIQRYAEAAVREHLSQDLQKKFFQEAKRSKYAPFVGATSQAEVDKLMDMAIKRTDRYLSMVRDGYSEKEINKAFHTPTEMRVFSWQGIKDTVMTPYDSIIYHKYFLRASFVAIEPQTGYVRAYVGGPAYSFFKYDNAAVGKRQVGSTFKPFVYASAFINDPTLTPCTKVPLIPVTFDMPDGSQWTPRNSGNVQEGTMIELSKALALSINWISAFLIKEKTTPEAVVELAKSMGITDTIPPVPSICLGTAELKLIELLSALSTFANSGVAQKPIMVTRIEDRFGNIISVFPYGVTHEVMDEFTAYKMISLMKGVVDYGTGSRIRYIYKIPYPVAGKTGTTDNNSDGWFIGITPKLAAGVWVGGEDMQIHFRSMALGQGASMALPIWGLFMQKVYADDSLNLYKGDFDRPAGMSYEMLCNPSTTDADGSSMPFIMPKKKKTWN